MTEVAVAQRSAEWFELRECMSLTASKFGEALGVGRGKPYDYLCSLIYPDSENLNPVESMYTRHGTQLEPVIDEAYQLLTRTQTKASGFWLPDRDELLHNMVGASPDALVLDKQGNCIGLAEYKAPVHCMYNTKRHGLHGIPRAYMAQIQGQLAICRKPWCDFMAVCIKSAEITLKRVHFHPIYWCTISAILRDFCIVLETAKDCQRKGLDPLDFPGAQRLKAIPSRSIPFQGESMIRVQDLLQCNEKQFFRTVFSQTWLSFDFLMGCPYELKNSSVKDYAADLLGLIDKQITDKYRKLNSDDQDVH